MFLRSLPTLMCLGIVSACAEDRRPEPSPAGTADAAASGPAVLGPTGPLPGATNVPLEGLFRFSYQVTPPAWKWKPKLEAAATYLCASAEQLVEVRDVLGKDGAPSYTVELVAKANLPADEWCWLRIQQSSELEVAYATGQGAWSTHFFTGSALRPIRVRFSPKNPDILSIVFSEPFDAAQLIGKLSLTLGDATVDCILRGTDCAKAGEPFLTSAVDVRLTSTATSAPLALKIPGTVMGSGRTVAQGAAKSGDALTAGSLSFRLEAQQWAPCDDGSSTCWSDHRPLPTK